MAERWFYAQRPEARADNTTCVTTIAELSENGSEVVEAAGIERPAVQPISTILELTASNTSAAIAALQTLDYRPRAPVRAEDFADEDIRASWREDKGLTVFSLWSPSYPGTEVDLFVEEPLDFGEAWSRRLDAVLDDGTIVHVVGIDDLRTLKARVGRPKDVDDIAQLDAIVHATLDGDEDDE